MTRVRSTNARLPCAGTDAFANAAVRMFGYLVLLVGMMWAVAAFPQEGGPRTFYVSSSSGDDTNDGRDPSRAWQSLAKVSGETFGPGDEIRFKAGDAFAGQLVLRSSGGPGRPITVSAFGAGPRPIIDGAAPPTGGFSAAVLVENQHDIEIRGLEITNFVGRLQRGEDPKTAAGILMLNDGGGVLAGIRLTDLYLHDIFAQKIAHATENQFNRVTVSAIRFVTTDRQSAATPSYFRDIRIDHNVIARTGRFGVQIGNQGFGGLPNRDAHSRDPDREFNREIIIAGNRFHELGGSAVQLAGARNALIENNDFDYSGSSVVPERMVGRGSGAWVVNSRDIVAQHNRSRHARGYKDSYGMHVDYGNLNILYQYNYSEDSEGGFVEILGNNRNIIWRYNISVNDGLREKEGNTLWLSTWSPGRVPSRDIFIYNNTIFVRPGLYPDISLTAHDAKVWNNLFFVSHSAMIGEETILNMLGGQLELSNNLFAGRVAKRLTVLDESRKSFDPRFVQPGATNPEAYRLLRASPALVAGVLVPHPAFPDAGVGVLHDVAAVPTTDFFGNALRSGASPSIGAYGGIGE